MQQKRKEQSKKGVLDTLEVRTKPVLLSSVQNTTQLHPSDSYYSLLCKLSNLKYILLGQNRIEWYIIEALYYNGCRISEVLNICSGDITYTGHVYLHSLKKSDRRMIVIPSATEYLLNCRNKSIKPFEGYNRQYVYRLLKKYGIELTLPGSHKKAVTHAFRHMFVNSQKRQGVDIKTIQTSIGHKNRENTENYGKDKI